MNIDHINIKATSTQIEAVKAFYCDALGLVDGFRPTFSTAGYWLYAGDNALLHLEVSDTSHGKHPAPYLDHVAFNANDVRSYTAKLDHMKLNYRAAYNAKADVAQLFFFDPVGNKIELNFKGENL